MPAKYTRWSIRHHGGWIDNLRLELDLLTDPVAFVYLQIFPNDV
jgi:hypothetical protein